MNTWETCAYEYADGADQLGADGAEASAFDRLIYPGLYSATGFNVMSVLVQVASRPNPQIDIGAVDDSCAIIVCDLQQKDQPIVYASDAFLHLTGYRRSEILGRNCRFLQAPGGKVRPKSARKYVDVDVIKKLRRAVDKNAELEIELPNFRKDGSCFLNHLTIIPIRADDGSGYAYSVGFQCDVSAC